MWGAKVQSWDRKKNSSAFLYHHCTCLKGLFILMVVDIVVNGCLSQAGDNTIKEQVMG